MPSLVEPPAQGLFAPLEKALWLHRICERNYRSLRRLVPGFDRPDVSGFLVWPRDPAKPALRIAILVRSAYTLELELTHDFAVLAQTRTEPRARIRVCLDARTVEMLSDQDRPELWAFLGPHAPPAGVLEYKWHLNYFLMRWLDHFEAAEYVEEVPVFQRLMRSTNRVP